MKNKIIFIEASFYDLVGYESESEFTKSWIRIRNRLCTEKLKFGSTIRNDGKIILYCILTMNRIGRGEKISKDYYTKEWCHKKKLFLNNKWEGKKNIYFYSYEWPCVIILQIIPVIQYFIAPNTPDKCTVLHNTQLN